MFVACATKRIIFQFLSVETQKYQNDRPRSYGGHENHRLFGCITGINVCSSTTTRGIHCTISGCPLRKLFTSPSLNYV